MLCSSNALHSAECACLQELGKQNPQLYGLITNNQAEFMRLLGEPANAPGPNQQAADLAAQLASAGAASCVVK